MKREKRLTKRERKALAPQRAPVPQNAKHIHCVACGKHLDPADFTAPATATLLLCQHRSQFASCLECVEISKRLLAEHDRNGTPVQSAAAWH
jgi:hypothetical protein